MIKPVLLLSFLLLLTLIAYGEKESQLIKVTEPKQLYQTYCALCHGADGTLGLNNATDLSISELNLEERIEIIETGKGMMMAYKSMLSKKQIKAIAKYSLTLKK